MYISFGVVTLEVLMGKHPGELISSFSTTNAQHILLKDLLDPRIPPPTENNTKGVILMGMVAFRCLQPDPNARPTMKQVAQFFATNNSHGFRKPFHTIELRDMLDL